MDWVAVVFMTGLLASALPTRAAVTARTVASPAQCETQHVLAAAGCRTAFANALAEFSAKAPSYRSRRACFQQFGPCMPWPPGTRSFDAFRPQLLGVTIDTSATEAAATPAVAAGKLHLDFAPQSVSSLSAAARVPTDDAGTKPVAKIMQPADDDGEAPASAPAIPGSGFKMIDGVLTYPAPARFQPKNLNRQ